MEAVERRLTEELVTAAVWANEKTRESHSEARKSILFMLSSLVVPKCIQSYILKNTLKW